jgi:ribulose-phosphate 3-epimerase
LAENGYHTRVTVKIAASILSADMARLGEQVAEAEAAGCDYVHLDVMDGHFVPNITIGPMVVEAVRRVTALPLDIHLMIERPEGYLAAFSDAGADILTVHVETCPHLHRTLQQIKELGCRAGVCINPATPVLLLEEALPYADLILVMTVNPGFGGQSFIHGSLPKIERVRALIRQQGSRAELEVDGGIGPETAALVTTAGADVLVAGSAIFRARDGVGRAIERIREAAEAGTRNGQPRTTGAGLEGRTP